MVDLNLDFLTKATVTITVGFQDLVDAVVEHVKRDQEQQKKIDSITGQVEDATADLNQSQEALQAAVDGLLDSALMKENK